MDVRLPRFARLRAGLLGSLGLALLAAACDTPLPTTQELEAMDVKSAEAGASRLQLIGDENATYFVDGKQVTREEAHALAADRIVELHMTRGSSGRVVNIYTHVPTAVEAHVAPGFGEVVLRPGGDERGEISRAAEPFNPRISFLAPTRNGGVAVAVPTTEGRFEGLMVIDGVVSEPGALRAMDTQEIASVEVIKGAAATRVYDDPRAAKGVIRITTRRTNP